ncbi:MAG: PD40 domain-containing protein [Deltaproteobacteria bacterium]|nr:PD40 domain-containing protein [Deltaproteobacteria bacterium]
MGLQENFQSMRPTRKPIRPAAWWMTVAALLTVAGIAAATLLRPAAVELISISFDNRAGNAASNGPAISADGNIVAFFSDAADLIHGDTNGVRDVFVRDRRNSRTERVSVSSSGAQGDLASQAGGDNPAISADGDLVAFYSKATNLVPNDNNDHADVFVRHRAAAITERVSLSSFAEQANDDSVNPSLDASGRLVAFQSLATNLVSNDNNGVSDIFVKDRISGVIERVCDGIEANAASSLPAISGDGQVVAFTSAANNLVPGDTNNRLDVFICDRRSGQITLVSASSDGVIGNGDSILPAISADGRFVAFKSLANNLVANDRNGLVDVFVRDVVAGTTERVSVNFLGGDSNATSYAPGIDCTGRFVIFGSEANNLDRDDLNEVASVFLRDRATSTTFVVDVNEKGEQANGAALDIAPAMSCDAMFITYSSLATNLKGPDFGQTADVFVNSYPCALGSSVCCDCPGPMCQSPVEGACPAECATLCNSTCPAPGSGEHCVPVGSPSATPTGGARTATPTVTGGPGTPTASKTPSGGKATATPTATGGTATASPTRSGGSTTPTFSPTRTSAPIESATATPSRTGGTATATPSIRSTSTPSRTEASGTRTPTARASATATDNHGTATATRTTTAVGTQTPGLDRDACHCAVAPGTTMSHTGGYLWLTGIAAMIWRRRR